MSGNLKNNYKKYKIIIIKVFLKTLQSNDKYFSSIDLIRAFAALSVLIYHVIVLKEVQYNIPILNWFKFGWIGVDIFLVLSGFVVTLSGIKLIQKSPDDFKITFLTRRILRIFPLYAITCIAYILFIEPELIIRNDFFRQVYTHLFFTHNTSLDTHGSINGVTWSIALEMQFYLFMLFLPRYTKRPIVFFLVCVSAAWLWKLGCFILTPQSVPNSGFILFFKTTQLPGSLDEFAIGFFTAYFYLYYKDILYRYKYWLLSLAILLVYVCTILFTNYAGYWVYPGMVVFFKPLIGLMTALVIITAINFEAFFSGAYLKPFKYFGKISYGIYLWHLIVIKAVNKLEISKLDYMILVIVITVILSSLSWHFFEKQFLDKTFSLKLLLPSRKITDLILKLKH